MEVKVERGKITFTPKTLVDRRIAEGLADFEAGRSFGPYKTHKEFISGLRRESKKLKIETQVR